MKLYICIKFHESIDDRFKVNKVNTILKLIISKGHYSEKSSRRNGSYLMMLYICTKFHENILDGIKVIEWTRFP